MNDGNYVLGSKNTVSLFEGMSFPELKTILPLKLNNDLHNHIKYLILNLIINLHQYT